MLKKYIITIIGFYIFWMGVLPFVVTNTAKVLCKNYSHNSNYEIILDNPRTILTPLPTGKFCADRISVKSKTDNTKAELENFKIKIRLLPLLSGRLHVNSVAAENFEFYTSLKENMELDKDFFKNLETARTDFNSIRIDKFRTELSQKDIKTPIVYSGENFLFQKKNKYVKFTINSTLEMQDRVSEADINLYLPKNNDIKNSVFEVNVSNLDIAPLKAYFKHYLPNDLTELQGTININANKGELVTELKNCAAIMKDSAKTITLPDVMNIKSKFNIKRHYITLENVDIESKNIHASLDGKISNYFGNAMPVLDLNIRVNKSKVEDFVNLLPAFKVEEIDVYKLKKYKFYGDALANLSVKGRLPEPDVTGDIYVNNGILTKPIPNTTQGATVKLKLTGKYAFFDVFVPAGGTEKVWVKGSQELYNVKYADMTIKSTPNVDLHVAQVVVNPLHEILNFVVGPVPIMDIYGKGNIDITVKGNRKTPHIWGVLNANNASVNFNEIPDLILKNADAVLNFNDQDAVFTTKKGTVNGKDFKVNGTCNLYGKFDFDVESQNQPTEELYKAIQTSTMVPDIQKMLPKLDKISGLTNLNLKVYGAVKYIEDLKFNENTFAKGEISIKDNDFTFQNITVNKTNGTVKFDNTSADADIKALISDAPMSIKAKIKNNIGDLVLDIPKLNPNFLIEDKFTREKQYLPYISVFAKYKGDINNIEYNKLNLQAKILESNPVSLLKFKSGEIIASNNRINVKNLKGYIGEAQNVIESDLRIENAFGKNTELNGNIRLKTPDLTLLNEILISDILPKELKQYTKDFEFQKGTIDLNCKFFNNKINMYTDLAGISFRYIPLELPIYIMNGTVSIRNNTLRLNKINLLADKMPILADGDIKDIFDKQNFNIYINSKPQQEFIDKYINKNQIYPIKIKGDIVYWARLKGVPDNYDLKTNIDLKKDSSIYHFGATVGDIENAISVYMDSQIINKNNFHIKDFSYDKLIESQSGRQTRLNMLKAKGGVELLKDDLGFKDLKIKTNTPTDARIFNIIFRKPNIKQGQFTSDLKINGKLSNPHVLGDFHIFETNIPFLDTTMKNIVIVFKDRTVEFTSKGDVMGNEVLFEGTLKNKLTKPYKIEKASLYTKNLDLNSVVNKLKIAQVDNTSTFESFEGFDLSSIVFNNMNFKADNIQLRNIKATNFNATASLNENGIFDINNFVFNIAQGHLGGKYKYNLKNNDTSLNLSAEKINANDITWALFDLNNQVYGDLTGTINISCNGTNFEHCMQTLNGNTIFNINQGRMPKLGSLEYLLKAGNLVKGGITGISINSVIDLITPLKTGDFEDIYGSIRIKDGVARNIEITTKGKDLSLFISGTYNFSTSVAEMEVLGMLSRKISTFLGPVGNMSINTLFNVIPGVDLSKDSLVLERINKIPGIELSEKAYRKFIAEIKGNINGEEYVTSFKWIN